MKKKISASTIVFFIHLFVCLVLSFDYPFLHGMYMGFGFTFAIIWGLTVPVVTAIIAIASVLIQAKKKKSCNVMEIISAIVSGIILIVYLASASGMLKTFSLEFIYIFVFIGTLFVWWCRCYKKNQNK